MGTTYENSLVRGPLQDQLVTYLTAQGQEALVSPTLNGLTFIYTPNGLAEKALSQAFHCPVFTARVYDDDYFWYWLFDDGDLADAYDEYTYASDPYAVPDLKEGESYEGPEQWWAPTGGDARLLCEAFGVAAQVDRVQALLHPPVEALNPYGRLFVGASEHHWALADVLGWPLSACSSDYRHLIDEAHPYDRESLVAAFGGRVLIKTPVI
jgi:hypothetical protein